MQGPESEELAAASRLEDDINFYQTAHSDVAKLFHIDPDVKRPALILLKKEEEKLNHFGLFSFLLFSFSEWRSGVLLGNLIYIHLVSTDGQFVKSAIADFVFSNKLPLVTSFTRETAPSVFENPIKKQVIGEYIVLSIWEETYFCNWGHNDLLTMLCVWNSVYCLLSFFFFRCCCLWLKMIQRSYSQYFMKQQNFSRERYISSIMLKRSFFE